MFDAFKKMLGPVPYSRSDSVNVDEVGRSTILGNITFVSVWTVMSVVWQVAQTVVTDPSFNTNLANFNELFKQKSYLALGIGVTTFICDILRRKYLHGK
jgi:hypothetical protein